MNVTRLFLLRHGEVEERYHRIFGGRIDMELSSLGLEQAQRLAEYLSRIRIDAVYCSPMKRARQTAAPLERYAPPPIVLPGLREVDFGDWTGHTWAEVKERFDVSAYSWLQQMDNGGFPKGETAAGFRARIEPCVRQILETHKGQTSAVVCHGGVVRAILAVIFNWPMPLTMAFDIEYASLTEVQFAAHKTEIHRLNFTPWRDVH
jgi:broad specificity phosphatase PhoE